MLRRFAPFVLVASLSTFFLLTVFQNIAWRTLPQAVGLGERIGPTDEEIASGINILPDLRTVPLPQKDAPVGSKGFAEPKINSTSPYPVGKLKPVGEFYTKCLVLPKLASEHTEWVEEELGDMIRDETLRHAIYVVDDRSAPLHPPKNKGHEAMVYLSYIIDHYDNLADVNIFMHSHRFAWHNNALFDGDAAQVVRHLSAERVTRDGYMNLRCHWDPGCPAWLHPGAAQRNYDKKEEWEIANSWAELFPLDPIPTVLAQPCCAQFAVSRERILATPKQRYITMRDWLLRTPIEDYISGRIFEYMWQYIFTLSAIHCPSMSACYCDGYGICFGSPELFDKWFEMKFFHEQLEDELREWNEEARRIAMLKMESQDGKVSEDAVLTIPEAGRNTVLEKKLQVLGEEMDTLKREAIERGKNPEQRAKEAGREWTEGNGF